jgi:hypothetical protein
MVTVATAASIKLALQAGPRALSCAQGSNVT